MSTFQSPYTTGHRAEPVLAIAPTVAADQHRSSGIDPDLFGRVSFVVAGDQLATAVIERTPSCRYVMDVRSSHPTLIIRETADDAHGDLREALAAYRSAVAAFQDACDEEERTGQEKDPEAYYNRDDAAVEFADVASRWIAERLGIED